MIQKDLQELSKTTRDLRKFGLVVGGVFALLGGWYLFRHRAAGPYLLTPGVILMFMGLVAPNKLKGIYIAWMGMAFAMGMVVSTVLLTVFYFVVVTPLSFVGRMVGKDFILEKLDPQAKSYWLVRDRAAPRPSADYEKQY